MMKKPIFVFDTRFQSDESISKTVDLMIELRFRKPVPKNTNLYAVYISDRHFIYNPVEKYVSNIAYE